MSNKTIKANGKLWFLWLLLIVSMAFIMWGFTAFNQTESGLDESKQERAVETLKNPVHHCTKEDDGTDYTDWSYIFFGSYPQSEVTDSTTIAAIEHAIEAGNTTKDTGVDVWVGDTKYRRIAKSDTNYDGYFGDNPYRYFKWERIRWRVLKNDGNTLFVVADKALDCKDYHDEYTSITWEGSTLRIWLNESFYQTAFSSEEQDAIAMQNVINEDSPYYNTEGGNNTTDKVYVLSIGEVTNPDYGFCEDDSTYSVSRRLQGSDYANARGAWRSTGISGEDENICWWWLRSPGRTCTDATSVINFGNVLSEGPYVIDYYGAVAPALHINLSSGIWSIENEDTNSSKNNIPFTLQAKISQ